eukprot:TRINITY_DN52308_c0_g1_i1.p1 TRINITY_DN52308_c0_g1~~TRINITY_DN52308_c0_g1_i1.p1  ORF type:complete len:115 (+),score=31.01 TRINITY_DN52308_c0_g1_i1:53-397(+)
MQASAGRRPKRRKLEPLLELCGLGKEANLSQTLATQQGSGSGSRDLTAPQCQKLCAHLAEGVELQRELAELELEHGSLEKDLREKQAEADLLQAKLRARQLLESVRTQLQKAAE